MSKIIFEDNDVKIIDTEQNYDFIAIIINKTNHDLYIDFTDEFMEFNDDTIIIQKNDWVGILANEKGREQLNKLYSGQYYINC